jgi:hypothetical protein
MNVLIVFIFLIAFEVILMYLGNEKTVNTVTSVALITTVVANIIAIVVVVTNFIQLFKMLQ